MFDYCNIQYHYKPGYKIITSILYSELTHEEKEENTMCPITIETFEDTTKVVKTKCNHIFSKEGLKLWLKSHNNCPMCRSAL